MKKTRKKLLTTLIPLCLTLLIVIIIYGGYLILFKSNEKSFLETVESSTYASASFYSIYGIHMNIEGSITLDEEVDSINLVLANKKNEIIIPSEFENTEKTYSFKTSNNINNGIILDNLPQEELYFLIKTSKKDENNKEIIKYYSIENKSSYKDLEYYTITKNNKNNKINIEWNTEDICPSLKFTIKETTLPDDVYDITIDPGHDAFDSGATVCLINNEIKGSQYCSKDEQKRENNANLNVSLKLKEELEKLGYKVIMTRDDSEDLVEIYKEHGSATLANETKSKFNLAIHHNSSGVEGGDKYLNGLELYVASKIDFRLSRAFVNNITKEANTETSPKTKYLTENGIYQRYFTEEEISEDDVQPSNKDTNTIYYYNIREVGGINTHATNDGRYAPEYPKNPYYDSNQTAESYLFELGYMDNIEDLNNILNNSDGYARGIAKGLEEYLNTEK